jgi:starvation-inducible DNA-binding protein
MVAVPSFVSSNAKRGLKLLEYAGDGLKAQTVREARDMASGSITAEKVRRMAAWLARHESDLSSPDAGAYLDGTKDRPTAGQVAWLLWGGDIGSGDRNRARLWAERKRDQLIADGELSKATENSNSTTPANLPNMMYMTQPPEEPQTMPAQEESMPAIDLTSALQELMANVLVFYASAHRAHWNVTGQDFREYHGLFEDIYSDVYESIDPLAENIRKIKGRPLNLSEMVAAASFADDSQTSAARELASDLMTKNLTMITMLKLVFEICEECEEQGIANFIAERIDSHMKWDWQLSASLSA